MLRTNNFKLIRYYSSIKSSSGISSTEIRQKFLDYFVNENDHKFIRSSPVVPFCDPTVAFVNAGMNQFKSVFLGKSIPNSRRAANSQKCVRVGGKHNDLSIVGADGYHHTFFEMLGNWSFGDYFKKEACTMALELLKGPYGMDTSRMYVTYFAGDEKLGLQPDLECYEIWRSLGFPENRILPFGCKDNFWEMGATGPCGPCTEIHYDHKPNLATGPNSRSKLVNAGTPDLTEIWNLVFIQYNRTDHGTITPLPERHVDTGMGFERLAAILQHKSSNYDTDIFTPILQAAHKISKAPPYGGNFENHTLDTSYRILADHSRMITACLSDGMLPDQNQKLRRVLRKALLLSENTFKNENLLSSLIPIVVDILGPTYPEMQNKLNNVQEIILHEQEVFKALRQSSSKAFSDILTEIPDFDDLDLMESPGFVPAFKELKTIKDNFANNTIPGQFIFKLSDTYGLGDYSIKKLAEIYNFQLDQDGFKDAIYRAKQKSKGNFNDVNTKFQQNLDAVLTRITQTCQDTDNHFKYDYSFNNQSKIYEVPTVKSKILSILRNDIEEKSIKLSSTNIKDVYSIITDKSNFYYESGGQESDQGYIIVSSTENSELKFKVQNVLSINNCIVHVGKFEKNDVDVNINIGDYVELHVDPIRRTNNTLHHTGTHFLNAAVRTLFNKVTYQVSSSVTADNLKLELGIIGKKLTKEDIDAIELLIRKTIKKHLPLDCSIINAADVLNRADITLVPGEIYPETNLRLISLASNGSQLQSTELCCGTHIHSSGHLQNFCITNLKQTNRARYAFTAVTGAIAEDAVNRSNSIKLRVDRLEEQFKTETNKHYMIDDELQKLRNSILHANLVLPYVFKQDILHRITEILKQIKEASRTTLKEFVDYEMKSILQEKPVEKYPYIVHYLRTSGLMEEVPLQRATKISSDRPSLIVSVSDGVIKARCCVPKNQISEEFSAQKWLNQFASVFKTQVSVPKGQNGNEVCNMRGRKIAATFDEQMELAMQLANKFASDKL